MGTAMDLQEPDAMAEAGILAGYWCGLVAIRIGMLRKMR